MNVKPLKHSEYAQMKQLFLDVFSHEPWNDRWANEELNAYMKELMENSNSLTLGLYDEEEELIGCSLGYVFSWWEGREYFIKEFFIARHRQKQGAGQAFLTLLNDFLKAEGVKHTTLMTEKTVPAYRFYQNNGFRELEDSAFFVKRVDRS